MARTGLRRGRAHCPAPVTTLAARAPEGTLGVMREAIPGVVLEAIPEAVMGDSGAEITARAAGRLRYLTPAPGPERVSLAPMSHRHHSCSSNSSSSSLRHNRGHRV